MEWDYSFHIHVYTKDVNKLGESRKNLSQDNIIKELRKMGEIPLSIDEISQKLIGKANLRSIGKALNQLEKYGEVKCIKIDVRIARKLYGNNHKKGMRMFYIEE